MSADKDFQKQLEKLSVPEIEKLLNKLQRQINLTESCVKAQQEHLAQLQENVRQAKSASDIKSMETASFTEKQSAIWEEHKENNTGNHWVVGYNPPGYSFAPCLSRLSISNMTYTANIYINTSPKGYKVDFYMHIRGTSYIPHDRKYPPRLLFHHARGFRTEDAFYRAKAWIQELQERYDSYFQEICPPVPRDRAIYFTVDNQLIPGYRLEESK